MSERMGWMVAAAIMLVFLIGAGALVVMEPEPAVEYPDVFTRNYVENRLRDHVAESEKDTPDPQPTFTDLVQTSLKGVVHLQAPNWQGSGFVVGPRHIITARHCTTGVVDFRFTTNDGHIFKATRAYRDKGHDVSHIWANDLECVNEDIDHRIKYGGEHEVVLSPLSLGSIEDCILGQDIYIIGSPYGFVNFNTVSRGIISGLDRDWDSTDPYTGESYGWAVAFTSDSSASPGNSGGPIFTMDGRVIGVLVGGYSSTVNCLMPSDLFMENLDVIRLKFIMDRYEQEKIPEYKEEWYNLWGLFHR